MDFLNKNTVKRFLIVFVLFQSMFATNQGYSQGGARYKGKLAFRYECMGEPNCENSMNMFTYSSKIVNIYDSYGTKMINPSTGSYNFVVNGYKDTIEFEVERWPGKVQLVNFQTTFGSDCLEPEWEYTGTGVSASEHYRMILLPNSWSPYIRANVPIVPVGTKLCNDEEPLILQVRDIQPGYTYEVGDGNIYSFTNNTSLPYSEDFEIDWKDVLGDNGVYYSGEEIIFSANYYFEGCYFSEYDSRASSGGYYLYFPPELDGIVQIVPPSCSNSDLSSKLSNGSIILPPLKATTPLYNVEVKRMEELDCNSCDIKTEVNPTSIYYSGNVVGYMSEYEGCQSSGVCDADVYSYQFRDKILALSAASDMIVLNQSDFDGSLQLNLNNLRPGYYKVHYEFMDTQDGNENPCGKDYIIQVIAPDPLVINNVSTNPSCELPDNGSVSFSLSGSAITPYEYVVGTETVTGSLSGSTHTINDLGIVTGQTLKITDGDGCTATGSFSISSQQQPVTIDYLKEMVCPGMNDASIRLDREGAWISNLQTVRYKKLTESSWTNGSLTYHSDDQYYEVTGFGTGTYSIEVTDAHSCQYGFDNQVFTQTPEIILQDTAKTSVLCADAVGAIQITATGGMDQLTYEPQTAGHNNNYTGLFNNLYPGTYAFKIHDNAGCYFQHVVDGSLTDILTVTLENPDLPSASLTAHERFQYESVPYHLKCAEDADGVFSDINLSGGKGGYNTGISTNFPMEIALLHVEDNVFLTNDQGDRYYYTVDASGNVITPQGVSVRAGTYVPFVHTAGCPDDIELAGSVQFNAPEKAHIDATSLQISPPAGHEGNDGWITLEGKDGVDTDGYTFDFYNKITDNFQTVPDGAFTGHQPGSYLFRVFDSNSCPGVDTTIVLEDQPELIPVFSLQNEISCRGMTDGVLEVSAMQAGEEVPVEVQWFTDPEMTALFSEEALLSELGPGTYYARISDGDGCSATGSYNLLPTDSIILKITEKKSVSCKGLNDGQLDLEVDYGSRDYCDLWATLAFASGAQFEKEVTHTAGGLMLVSFSNLPSGDFSLVVNDRTFGCNSVAYNDSMPTNTVNYELMEVSDVSCFGKDDGSVLCNPVSGKLPLTYTLTGDNTYQNGVGVNAVYGVAPGTYTLTVTDANGCPSDKEIPVTVQEPPELITSLTSSTSQSCIEQGGSALFNIEGGTPDYSINLSGTDLGSINIDTAFQQNGFVDLHKLKASDYTLEVEDARGCTSTIDFSISESPAPDINIVVSRSSYCNLPTGAALISVAGRDISDFDIVWNDPSQQNAPEAIDLLAGIYKAEITDRVSGCNYSRTIEITDASETLSFDVSILSESSCNADEGEAEIQITEGGEEPYTFDWSGNPSNPVIDPSNPAHASGLASGIYHAVVTDINGCRNTVYFAIGNSNGPTVEITGFTQPYCDLPTGSIQAGASGYSTIRWYQNDNLMPENTSLEISDATAGYYFVEAVDAQNCTNTAGILLEDDVSEEPELTVTETIPDACGNGIGSITVQMTGGDPDYTYQWLSPASTSGPTATGLEAGIAYTVEGQDAKGCKKSLTLEVGTSDPPVLRIDYQNIENAYCGLPVGRFDVYAEEGEAPYTYILNRSQSFTTGTIENLLPDTYYVVAEDANGCQSNEIIVHIEELPGTNNLVTAINIPECHNTRDGSVTIVTSEGVAPYSYVNEAGDTFTSGLVTGLRGGAQMITVIDDAGCETEFTIVMPSPDTLGVRDYAVKDPLCHDSSDGEAVLFLEGGTSPYLVTWPDNRTGQEMTGLKGGIYQLNIQDGKGCETTYDLILTAPPDYIEQLPDFDIVCEGQTIALDLGADWLSVNWKSDNGFSSNEPSVKLTEAGSYFIEAVNLQNCVLRDTFDLETSTSLLEADFVMSSTAVVGDTLVLVNISIPDPDSLSWTFPGSFDLIADEGNTIKLFAMSEGTYAVSLTSQLYGCKSFMAKEVTVEGFVPDNPEDGRLGYQGEAIECSIYPNPSSGRFTLEIDMDEPSEVWVKVYHMQTKESVYEWHDSGQDFYTKEIDMSQNSSGLYIMRITSESGTKGLVFVIF